MVRTRERGDKRKGRKGKERKEGRGNEKKRKLWKGRGKQGN